MNLYIPEGEEGHVNIKKAIDICTQFKTSNQFWSFLVNEGFIKDSKYFITLDPHRSWVQGEENVGYLEKQYKAFKEHFMFDSIEFSREVGKMKE